MGISETKKQIVIDNYFKNTCDVNTSIKEAFTKGFEVGLTKAVFPKDQYEARLKADIESILDKIRAEIEEYRSRQLTLAIGVEDLENGKQIAIEYVLAIIDKYRAESEG